MSLPPSEPEEREIQEESTIPTQTSSFAQSLQAFTHVPDPSSTSTSTAAASHLSLKRNAGSEAAAPNSKRVTRSSSRTPQAQDATSDTAKRVASPKARADANGRSPAARSPVARTPSSTSTAAEGRGAARGPAAPGNPRGVVSKLTDALDENLFVMFVGVNPGIMTAETGHAYAHPSNHFWKLLHKASLTPRLCHPSETHALVRWLRLGNTNLVSRATKDASTLSKAELDAGVADIERKAAQFRPQAVCIVGKGIWESIARVWKGRGYKVAPFKYGWQPDGERLGKGMGMERKGVASMFGAAAGKAEKGQVDKGDGEVVTGANGDIAATAKTHEEWKGARVFVATTTSGLAASMSWDEKLAIWRELGEWVLQQRAEEGWTPTAEPES